MFEQSLRKCIAYRGYKVLTSHYSCFPRQKRGKRLQYTVAHGNAWFITAFQWLFFLQETSNSKWINLVYYIIGVLFACSEIPLLSIHTSMYIYIHHNLKYAQFMDYIQSFWKEGHEKPDDIQFVHMFNIIFLRMCLSRIFDIIMLIQ